MKITLEELKEKFEELINQKKSREEISEWAIEKQKAEDLQLLEYDPPEDEDKIWERVSYLTGVDLKDLDRQYLHSIQNFIDFNAMLEEKE